MTGVQEQVFQCLRSVAEYANNNRLEGLQAAIDRAEEVALLEVLGIDVTKPIEVEEDAFVMKEILPYFGEEKT